HAEEAYRIAEELGDPRDVASAVWQLGHLHGLRGEFDQAIRLLERGLSLERGAVQSHESSLPIRSVMMAATVGHVLAQRGRVGEGLALLLQAVKTRKALGTLGSGMSYSLFLTQLGEAYRLARRPEEARAWAEQALAVSRRTGERAHEARALWLLGDIAAHAD